MQKSYRITAPYFGDGEFNNYVDRMKNTTGPTEFETGIFGGLQRLSHVYAGTVPVEEIVRRRDRNRRARWARRGNVSALAREARRCRRRRGQRFRRGQAPNLNLGGAE